MKTLFKLFMIIAISLGMMQCKEKEPEPSGEIIIGTWIEKNPELFDGISDTINFMCNLYVSKHFYFNGWQYSIVNDTVFFQNEGITKKFLISIPRKNEMILYNFIDRSITAQVKNIQFIKIK